MDEHIEMAEQPVSDRRIENNNSQAASSRSGVSNGRSIAPQGACSTCGSTMSDSNGAGTPSYVYAIGKIEARFPNLASEKEFAQASGRTENTAGKTDQQTFREVLSNRENRYLIRQLCWVFTIQALDTYILLPRNPLDIDLLVESLRATSSPNDVDVVIGTRGPIAPPTMCNGLMVPIVRFDQIYSFDRYSLVKAIPRPQNTSEEQFAPAAEELFGRIIQVTDNAGATDEHRALNYLAMRYPGIYARAAEQFGRDFSLSGVDVRPSPLSGARNIVDVIFSYTNRNTDFTEKYFVRCDMTEEFPFLVSKMAPYYDR